VADWGNDRVQFFGASLDVFGSIGATGSGPGQFDQPFDLAFDSTNARLLVTDSVNNRVQVWASPLDLPSKPAAPRSARAAPVKWSADVHCYVGAVICNTENSAPRARIVR